MERRRRPGTCRVGGAPRSGDTPVTGETRRARCATTGRAGTTVTRVANRYASHQLKASFLRASGDLVVACAPMTSLVTGLGLGAAGYLVNAPGVAASGAVVAGAGLYVERMQARALRRRPRAGGAGAAPPPPGRADAQPERGHRAAPDDRPAAARRRRLPAGPDRHRGRPRRP